MIKICQNAITAIQTDHGESIKELVSPLSKNSTKDISIAICEIRPQCASLKHYHPIVEETYHITEGTAKIIIDNQEALLAKGDTVVIPPNASHQIFNTGTLPLKFMVICAPAWTPDCSVFT